MYQPLSEGKELEIETRYTLGGTSYFTGQHSPRGIYVHLAPVERSTSTSGFGVVSRVLLGSLEETGYKIKLEELSRKSQKKVEYWTKRVEPLAPKLAELFGAGQHQEVAKLIEALKVTQ